MSSLLNLLSRGWAKALTALGVVLTALLSLFAYGWAKKREGASMALNKALQGNQKKEEAARAAAYKEKRDVAGLSDSDVVDRLRRRSDDWGGL